MSVLVETWEKQLLAQAHAPSETFLRQEAELLMDQAQRRRAYLRCEAITRDHSRTFFIASSLLPPDQQQAMRALYAFCRVSDDLVDRNPDNQAEMLADWRARSMTGTPPADDLVAWAWVDTRTRHRIPRQYAEQLLDGIATDLTKSRYNSFDDLAHYCYAVASTVGLMVMHIVGYAGKDAIPYAVKLGVALQMTNILRDVGEDWRNGRLYLPQDELADFGLTEADVANGIVDERWRDFMRFQIDRTRRLYAEALPGVGLLGRRGRFAVGAASELYQAILKDIEAHDYDVFTRRAHTRDLQKLALMPGIWWRSRSGKYPAHRVAPM